MTDKEKYDFIDHIVHLTLFEEDRLLNEHGGEYSGLEEDGIDSNEYYRIITERVINTLKKNNNYIKEEPVSEDLEEAIVQSFTYHENHGDDFRSDKQIETAYKYGFKSGVKYKELTSSIIEDIEKQNLKLKEVDLEKSISDWLFEGLPNDEEEIDYIKETAKHFFELGLKAQKYE